MWLILVEDLAVCAKQVTVKDENVNNCIRMGINIAKFVIWGGKLSVLWSQIAFYGSADMLP